MNHELRRRSLELNAVNGRFESVLLSVRVAAIVVDQELRVVVWDRGAEDLWDVRADEAVGRGLLDLDVGLPFDDLRDPIRACLSGESHRATLMPAAMNRRGRALAAQVICTPLAREEGAQGLIILMEQPETPQASVAGGSRPPAAPLGLLAV